MEEVWQGGEVHTRCLEKLFKGKTDLCLSYQYYTQELCRLICFLLVHAIFWRKNVHSNTTSPPKDPEGARLNAKFTTILTCILHVDYPCLHHFFDPIFLGAYLAVVKGDGGRGGSKHGTAVSTCLGVRFTDPTSPTLPRKEGRRPHLQQKTFYEPFRQTDLYL